MKLLFDFFPLLAFFIAYKFGGIYVATAVLIVVTAAQVIFSWMKHRKVDPMLWVVFFLVLIFGGATLWEHDPEFLKWKVSIVNWLFAAAFFGSSLFTRKPLVQRLLETNVQLTESIWRRLNLGWGLFFLVMGCLNYYVMKHYSTDIWVDFKVFGIFGLTLVFIVLQTLYLLKHIQSEEK